MPKTNHVELSQEVSEHQYFTMLPNILFEMDLDPLSFRLYCQLKKMCGVSRDKIKISCRNLSLLTGISIGAIFKHKEMLIKAGLIIVKPGEKTQGKSDQIILRNLWPDNFKHFQDKKLKETCSPDEQGCSPDEQGCSPDEQGCSPDEHMKDPIKEEIKKETNKEKTLAIADSNCVSVDTNNLEKTSKQKETEKLTPEQVKIHRSLMAYEKSVLGVSGGAASAVQLARALRNNADPEMLKEIFQAQLSATWRSKVNWATVVQEWPTFRARLNNPQITVEKKTENRFETKYEKSQRLAEEAIAKARAERLEKERIEKERMLQHG